MSAINIESSRSDHLKDVPHQLETLIGDKKFLQAAHILVRSLRTINKPELAQIGALSDLKLYFKNQETVSIAMAAPLMPDSERYSRG